MLLGVGVVLVVLVGGSSGLLSVGLDGLDVQRGVGAAG